MSPVILLDWGGLGVFSLDSSAAASAARVRESRVRTVLPCPPWRPHGHGAKGKQVVLNLNLKLNLGSL